MVGRVSAAVRCERVVLLVKVAILREGTENLLDWLGDVKRGIRQGHTCRNRSRTCMPLWRPCRSETVGWRIQVARKGGKECQLRRIRLIRNHVQRGQMSSLGTHIGDADLQVLRDLALHVEVPGLNVSRPSAV